VQPRKELIRQATEADLSDVAAIWYESTTEGQSNPRPLHHAPSLYLHELETRELFVLERDEQVVAFAAVINRGSIAFLADLFVGAAYRSRGLGQQLLNHVLPRDGRICCTVSSRDPRAMPLYVRFGMRPYWPHTHLRANLATLGNLSAGEVDVREAHVEDSEWASWDAEISGRARPEDYAFWLRRRGGLALWFVRNGRTIGYGMAQTRSDDLLAHPDAVSLGPIGTRRREDAVECVLAAVRWAQQRATVARITLTGPHPAMAPLLTAGFRITEVETFCLTAAEAFVDVQRYVPSGSDLF
jgi:GNAT superfamily N-acetyltransferase